jgi:hypothetical protein
MQPGSLVQLRTPNFFYPNHFTVGTLVRMPIPGAEPNTKDSCCLVQVGSDPRFRPVRMEHLEDLGKDGTPVAELHKRLADWQHQRQEKLKALEASTVTAPPGAARAVDPKTPAPRP